MRTWLRGLTVLMACLVGTVLAAAALRAAEPPPSGLEWRPVLEHGLSPERGTPIPREAVSVFTYEGGYRGYDQPIGIAVGPESIAVDYGQSGVLFDRKSGQVRGRVTVADGWPKARPDGFPPAYKPGQAHLVGPGIVEARHGGEDVPDREVVLTAEFGGRTWKAYQPGSALYWRGRSYFGPDTWTDILREGSAKSFLESTARDGRKPVRYTTAEGLAGNIVTHLAVADGALWAACVDIYNPEKKEWGDGGLARYDTKSDRWERVKEVDGRPVRWVTLLQAVGDDLWIGFREGEGVVGDKILHGMGIYPEQYRPNAKRLVLTRLAGGKWKSFARDLAPETPAARYPGEPGEPPEPPRPPTETPRKLAVAGDKVVLFTQKEWHGSGNWDVEMEGCLHLFDLAAGKWKTFDVDKDFDANLILELAGGRGEVLAVTDRGLHRWSADGKWTFMDTGSPIKNPNVHAVVRVGKELWVGYNVQSFGVVGTQGISRYDEAAGRWSWMSPQEIGTSAPVESMAALPNGDVWVLFGHQEYFGAAEEWPFYPREKWDAPTGIARFSGGKWEFPARLDGVPEQRQKEYTDEAGVKSTWKGPLFAQHITAVGDRLFLVHDAGVFMGPGKWKQIVEVQDRQESFRGTRNIKIEAGADGKSLIIFRRLEPKEGEPGLRLQRGRYDIAADKLVFEPVAKKIEEYDWHSSRDYSLSEPDVDLPWPQKPWIQSWVKVPTRKPGTWVVGDLQSDDYHRVVETSQAVWIIGQGELSRLDREKLRD